MFHVVLYQPEIPPNTGNVIRLCVNAGATLHLIHPLGFELEDAKLRRAGLDYGEWCSVREHASLDAFIDAAAPARLLGFSAHATRRYDAVRYAPGDALLFGPEMRGLPAAVRRRLGENHLLHIPMVAGNRSLNLSNAVAVVVYEAWRQNSYKSS